MAEAIRWIKGSYEQWIDLLNCNHYPIFLLITTDSSELDNEDIPLAELVCFATNTLVPWQRMSLWQLTKIWIYWWYIWGIHSGHCERGLSVSECENKGPDTLDLETAVSEARNALSVLLRLTEAKGGECHIKCITTLELSMKNISSLTSKQAAISNFLPNANLSLYECECE